MALNKNSLILFTGGHLTPAVAVIGELSKRGYSNFVWVGHKYNQRGTSSLSPEYNTIAQLNIPFIDLRTGKIIRKWTPETFISGISNFFLIFWGIFKSLLIILKTRPQLIVSFGGYLALPIALWGRILGVTVVTHEQTIVVGLANKIIGKLANKVFVSWESSRQFFNISKVILTGNPIRHDVFQIKSNTLTKDFKKQLPILLIYGGNQGSNEINRRIFEILSKLLIECNVIHQTGNSSVTNDFKTANALRENLPQDIKNRYTVRDFILQDEVGEALNQADLIFGRAGANNMSEFLALGKLAILMPIPWTSHDEQTKNAKYIEETGLGYVLTQKDSLTAETVYQTLLLALNQLKTGKGFNGKDIEECRDLAKSKIILNAQERVVDEIEKLGSNY